MFCFFVVVVVVVVVVNVVVVVAFAPRVFLRVLCLFICLILKGTFPKYVFYQDYWDMCSFLTNGICKGKILSRNLGLSLSLQTVVC